MTEPKLIAHVSGDTTTPGTSTPRGARPLPPDLLRQASRRFEVLALLNAMLALVLPVLAHLAYPVNPADPHWAERVPDAVGASMILGSLGLVFYLRKAQPHPQRVLAIALVYLLLASLMAGVMANWKRPLSMAGGPVISWIGPFLVIFAALIPVAPRRMFVAGLLAASMDPLGTAIWQATGQYHGASVGDLFLMHSANYVLLGVAVVISGVVTRLGQQVAEARELGSYRLIEPLGGGAMGEVWRAEHRMLARPAAIKLIRPEALGARDAESRRTLQRRFEREAQATALLRSPHTIEIYDFGVAEGTFYYVMELLDGFDLNDLVERFGPVPAERAVDLLLQMCESLAEAHEAGLIHRDVKPANAYVCRYGREVDFVKLLDFGIVKQMRTSGQLADRLTASDLISGTPAFMSPEQVMAGESIDGRSDLYALGGVAYWLLTAKTVFSGRTAAETMLLQVTRNPEPPSRHTANPIPAELEQVVLACLAKDPADRPATADELAAQLSSVPLTREWSRARAQEWWDTHLSKAVSRSSACDGS